MKAKIATLSIVALSLAAAAPAQALTIHRAKQMISARIVPHDPILRCHHVDRRQVACNVHFRYERQGDGLVAYPFSIRARVFPHGVQWR